LSSPYATKSDNLPLVEEMIEIPEGTFMMGCNEEVDTYLMN